MKTKAWKDVVFLAPPKVGAVTAESVHNIKESSSRYRGSVRLATGRVIVDNEYEKKRKALLQRTLP